MDETLTFELPRHGEAVGLRAELASSRLCLVDYEDGIWRVVAGVGPEPEDFADLLRTVEAWVARTGVYGLRFRVDGRSYVLVAGEIGALAAA